MRCDRHDPRAVCQGTFLARWWL